MSLIGIRIDGDAGGEAGMGHVYRAVAYARRLCEEMPSVSVRFFMRDFPEGLAKVRGEGFAVSVLPARPARADFDEVFSKHPPDVFIIDILGSSRELIEAARVSAQAVITVDDLEPSAAETDLVVNGILWGTRLLPTPFGRAKVYQGIEYIQLREQFAAANRTARTCSSSVRNILISTGGADGRGFSLQLMKAVREIPFEFSVSVMAGPAFSKIEELRSAAESMSGRTKFSVFNDTPDMAAFLIKSDLALITGGTVMFESAACGTPAVIACSYEHQVPQAEWFSARGTAMNLGYFAGQVDGTRLRHAIEQLRDDQFVRQRMSDAGKATVDGQGLDRFIAIVRSFLEAEGH